jgi:arylsulfatase A
VHKDLIDFSDFLPTFCEIAGASTEPLTLDGRSFLPQLHGETGKPRDFVYCWYNRDMQLGAT